MCQAVRGLPFGLRVVLGPRPRQEDLSYIDRDVANVVMITIKTMFLTMMIMNVVRIELTVLLFKLLDSGVAVF